jgi:hypothetical protein
MHRLRRLWQNFGIGATRVDIRSHAAWYADIALGAAGTLVCVLLVYGAWQYLRSPEEVNVENLRARLEELEGQAAQDDGVLASNLEITRSANRQLSDELRLLSDEQAVLKDDLAYFLRLVPVGTSEGELRLDRFIVRPETVTDAAAGAVQRYHYSVLVGYHAGRQTGEFVGTLKFVLTVEQDGKPLQRILPADAPMTALPQFQVTTHQWVRKEGVLEVAPGEVLKKVELRLVQANRARAVASVTF